MPLQITGEWELIVMVTVNAFDSVSSNGWRLWKIAPKYIVLYVSVCVCRWEEPNLYACSRSKSFEKRTGLDALTIVGRQSPSEPWTRWLLRSRFPQSRLWLSCRLAMSTTNERRRTKPMSTKPFYWKRWTVVVVVATAWPTPVRLRQPTTGRSVGGKALRASQWLQSSNHTVNIKATWLKRNGKNHQKRESSIIKTITCRWPCRIKSIRLFIWSNRMETHLVAGLKLRTAVDLHGVDEDASFAGGFSSSFYWSPSLALPSLPSLSSHYSARDKVIRFFHFKGFFILFFLNNQQFYLRAPISSPDFRAGIVADLPIVNHWIPMRKSITLNTEIADFRFSIGPEKLSLFGAYRCVGFCWMRWS